MDDDVFVCGDGLMEDLEKYSKNGDFHNIYYGWQWFNNDPMPVPLPSKNKCDLKIDKRCYNGQVSERTRMDEFFVILGSNLGKGSK